MPVTHVQSESELTSKVSSKPNGLFVIKFTASWCGPCKQIQPVYEKLSTIHSRVFQFFEVDVDDLPDFAQSQRVRAMPTFVFYKSSLSNELARIQGADANGLTNKLNEIASQHKETFSGEGNVLGGAGSSTTKLSGKPSDLSEAEMIQRAQGKLSVEGSNVARVAVRFSSKVGNLNKANLMISGNEPVSKLRDFVDTLLELTVGKATYELHNSYPPGILNESQSVNDSGISGSVILVKLK